MQDENTFSIKLVQLAHAFQKCWKQIRKCRKDLTLSENYYLSKKKKQICSRLYIIYPFRDFGLALGHTLKKTTPKHKTKKPKRKYTTSQTTTTPKPPNTNKPLQTKQWKHPPSPQTVQPLQFSAFQSTANKTYSCLVLTVMHIGTKLLHPNRFCKKWRKVVNLNAGPTNLQAELYHMTFFLFCFKRLRWHSLLD